MKEWQMAFCRKAKDANFPIFTPYYELTRKQKDMLWHGFPSDTGKNGKLEDDAVCLDAFFRMVKENQDSVQGDDESLPWQDGLSGVPWHETEKRGNLG